MKKLLLCLSLLSFHSGIFCQTLVPWLGKNGQYGYADEDGQVVIPAQFKSLETGFAADDLSIRLTENDRDFLLLRNGMRFPYNAYADCLPIKNYDLDGNTLLGKLEHLVQVSWNDTIHLVDIRSRKIKVCFGYESIKGLKWFTANRNLYPPDSYDHRVFIRGVCPIWKAPGKMNFLDADLNELFPRDFAAGAIADGQYFIVAEGPGKCAVADRKGKIRTPFAWKNLSPGGKEGYFIVNHKHEYSEEEAPSGLIDANGKLIIDTIYTNIKPLPNFELLVVQKDGKSGLVDYKGRSILPIESNNIFSSRIGKWIIINFGDYKNLRWNLLNEHGEYGFLEDAAFIRQHLDHAQNHFTVRRTDSIYLYNEQLQLLHKNLGFDASIIQKAPIRIKIEKKAAEKSLFGLLDEQGRELIPAQYDQLINTFLPSKGYLLAIKDSLWGIMNLDGQEILPQKFISITKEYRQEDTILWCQEKNPRLWFAFDLNGKKLQLDPRLSPYPGKNPVVGESPDKLYFNHNLQNLIPQGFEVLKALEYENPIEKTGLIVVYRHRKGAMPPPVEEDPKKLKRRQTQENQLIVPLEPLYDACGVLNASGNWVLPPKEGVRYIPFSHNVIAEVPFRMSFSADHRHSYLIRIHLINKDKKTFVDVNAVKSKSFEHPNMPFGIVQLDGAYKGLLFDAYFDEQGNQLTPFYISNGPAYLRRRNLVYAAKSVELKDFTQMIIDEKGKVIHNLDTLLCANIPPNWAKESQLDYFIVEEKLTQQVTRQRRYLAAFHGKKYPLQGIMDSVGNLVHPLRYEKIKIIAPNRMFSAKNAHGHMQVFNWKGDLLYQFPSSRDTLTFNPLPTDVIFQDQSIDDDPLQTDPAISQKEKVRKKFLKPTLYGLAVRVLKSGYILVGHEYKTVLFSPDNQVIKEFPVAYYGVKNNMPDYFQAIDPSDELFWVNLKSGRIFRE